MALLDDDADSEAGEVVELDPDAPVLDGGAVEAVMSEEELLALQKRQEEEEKLRRAKAAARLDALGESLARTRSEAIQARQLSGIEQDWLEDEEFYQGIDDANRHEMSNAWRTKNAGQVFSNARPVKNQSIVFPNITAPYVNAAAAKVSDILMPSDDAGFDLLPTPIPELIEAAESGVIPGGAVGQPGQPTPQQLAAVNAQGQQMAAQPQGQMAPGQMQAPPATPEQLAAQQREAVKAQAMAIIEEAKAKAKKAKQRIRDWDVQCQYHGEMRVVIKDAARIGSGVIKGPFPVKRSGLAWINGRIVKGDKIEPASKRIDAWNFYPDGACGENLQNGSYTWERDDLTEKQLQDLKGTPGYIDWQIDACQREGPQRAVAMDSKNPDRLVTPSTNKKFEIWYFHGRVKPEDLEAAGCPCEEGQVDSIPAMLTMVNSRVIRATFNPLDSGDFPYDIVPWQKRPGMPWGKGVARLGRVAQRIHVAAWRAKMDNAGLGSGPMWIIKNGTVTPINGVNEIAARKGWQMAEDADIDDVRKAFAFIDYPMMTADLDAIIRASEKMMEDVTGLPALLQGQQGGAPDILGVINLLNNNASSVLRELARTFDDRVTEPRVRRYYRWLLQYGKDDEKGDFQIDARGSSANVEREIQKQEAAAVMQMSANPIYGLDPKKSAKEFLISRRYDPKNFEFDDEEWKKIVANMAKGPQDPRMAVAQLRAQLEERLLGMEQAFEAQENERDRQVELAIKFMDERLADKSLGSEERKTVEKIKADLAKVVMTLNTQKQLSREGGNREMTKHVTPQAAKPAAEPAGRAQPGKAFIQ